MQLEREEVIKSIFIEIISDMIVYKDRLNNILRHRKNYSVLHHSLLNDVVYLNSSRHPTYMIFWMAKSICR
jgi:hypothetical protein